MTTFLQVLPLQCGSGCRSRFGKSELRLMVGSVLVLNFLESRWRNSVGAKQTDYYVLVLETRVPKLCILDVSVTYKAFLNDNHDDLMIFLHRQSPQI